MITAAADGSALGNPGPAGWAWYVDESCWGAGGWPHATNNQGELKAVLELFRATEHLDDELLVLCDSQYVINSVTKWMRGWKAKGWRKGDGKPVLNLELLMEIDEAIAGRKYRFEWVKGHANHPLNEAADSRARAVAEAFQRGARIPSGPGWVRAGDAAPDQRRGRLVGAAITAEVAADVAADVASNIATLPSTHPELFSFEAEPEPETAVTVLLGPQEHARLVKRAKARGVSPERLLRDLI